MENNENNVQNQVDEVKKENETKANPTNDAGNKKITISLFAIVLILVLGIGIGVGFLLSKGRNNEKQNLTANDAPNSQVTNNTSTNNVIENNVIENTTNTANTSNITNRSQDPKVVTNVIEKTINEDQLNSRQMVVTGLNSVGEKVWEYTTLKENCPVESVNRSLKLIGTRNNKVYICDWGKLYILDERTGKVLYSNTEVNMGGAAVTTFDENNNLYTASYLAPVYKFDEKGTKLIETGELWDKGFIWPMSMIIKDDILIIGYDTEAYAEVTTSDLHFIKGFNDTNSYNGNVQEFNKYLDNINGVQTKEMTINIECDGKTETSQINNIDNYNSISQINSILRNCCYEYPLSIKRNISHTAEIKYDNGYVVKYYYNLYSNNLYIGVIDNSGNEKSFMCSNEKNRRDVIGIIDKYVQVGQTAMQDFSIEKFKNTEFRSELKNGFYYSIKFDEKGKISITGIIPGDGYYSTTNALNGYYYPASSGAAGSADVHAKSYEYDTKDGYKMKSVMIIYSNYYDADEVDSISLTIGFDSAQTQNIELKKVK